MPAARLASSFERRASFACFAARVFLRASLRRAPSSPLLGVGGTDAGAGTDALTLRVVGGGVNVTIPLRARIDAAPGAIAAMLDVFVDGAIVEVFANDGEGVTALSLSDVTAATYALRVVGGASNVPNVTLTAWGMDASVE